MASGKSTKASSIDPDEIARFSALAGEWWDAKGKFAPLHRLNPVRLGFIRDEALTHFGRRASDRAPFQALRLLDIGCGGGLLAEPMARLGFAVTGIDASVPNVASASAHAAEQGLAIAYRHGSAEELADDEERFDVVLAMEIVEHVADRDAFLTLCADLIAPGGLMVVATINRTPKAYALAIIGAERVLKWIPEGTHHYDKLVRPAELEAPLTEAGLTIRTRTGVGYSPLRDRWALSPDMSVNYMLSAIKPGASR